MTRLDEFDKVEWFDIARKLKPGLTEKEYNEMWDEFQQLKADYQRKMKLQ